MMMTTTKRLLWLFVLLWPTCSAVAQRGNVSAGGDITSAGGQVNFSVGQVSYIAPSGSGASASQGNQQAYVVTNLVGINVSTIALDLIVYPNPAQDNITLSISELEKRQLRCVIFTTDGRLVFEKDVNAGKTILPMAELAKGTYLITVLFKDKTIKSFNVIKN
jgi:hypothetical protein